MGIIKNEIGKVYGRLSVVAYVGLNKDKKATWDCICVCGNHTIVSGKSLRSGNTVSCGCYGKDRVTKHGLCYTTLYRVWSDMKQRCYNLNNKHYKDYGGRGITVCDRWKNSFENFYADMGASYENHLSTCSTTQIDRENNFLGYCPENCKWSTAVENANNTRLLRYFVAISPGGTKYTASSQSLFAMQHDLKAYGINHCLNNRQATHGGWQFKYKEE